MSLTYKRKSTGPNTDPCGTPNGFLVYWKTSQISEPPATHEVHIIGVIAGQTKFPLFAKHSHGPIIRLWSRYHEYKQ